MLLGCHQIGFGEAKCFKKTCFFFLEKKNIKQHLTKQFETFEV